MITLIEIFRLLLMTAAIGYIFSVSIKYVGPYDPLIQPKKNRWEGIKLGILAAAPAVVLHEMAHKFVALAFGLQAEFFASYFGLALGVVLRAISSPILIFIPGYVQITGATPLQSAITAFVGPLMNGILWLVSLLVMKYGKNLSERTLLVLSLSRKINGLLFWFNLIPIPPFDGGHVVQGLIEMFKASSA